MKRGFQIDFLRRMGLQRHHRLLDLGCGTLRGGVPLIGFLDPEHYTGVDVRGDVLEDGRMELREHGLEDKRPRLVLASSLEGLDLGERFDIAWAFSVLIHMDDDVLDDAIAAVARHLQPGGRFYANVNLGVGAAGEWQGFPVVRREWDFYGASFARHGFSIEDLGPLAAFGHHHPRLSPEQQKRQRMLKAARR
jgi:SAM-dependent methyltransferase